MLYVYENLYLDKKVYFAGPEGFYPWGKKLMAAQKALAEAWGISTSKPGDQPEPDLSAIHDPKAKAAAIFQDIVAKMRASDYIIANIECFRGWQPDSGTAFDLGMAYALGLKSYAVTRDKRQIRYKNLDAHLDPADGRLLDDQGRKLPEANQPVNLMIGASSKIVEGVSFEPALAQLFLDLEEEAKAMGAMDYQPPAVKPVVIPKGPPWKVYVAGTWVFEPNWLELADHIRALCGQYNLESVFPAADEGPRPAYANPWSYQYYVFDLHSSKLKESNVIIADLNPFQGYEPDCGTAFECGAAYMFGHKMYGYMDDLAPLIDKVPNVVKEDGRHYDQFGSVVDDYGCPTNLRFASSMKLFEGKFQQVIRQVALDLGAITE